MTGPFWAVYVAKIGGDIEVAVMAIALFFLIRGLASNAISRIENKYKETKIFIYRQYFAGFRIFWLYICFKANTTKTNYQEIRIGAPS